MKVAIIHDWLINPGGAERVLESIIELFPDSDIFTLIDFLDEKDRSFLKGKTIKTSFLQKLPFVKNKYPYYLFLMPYAIEQFDLSSYDLILSSSHAVAKGVITSPNQIHISYIYTPIRYLWDMYHRYLDNLNLKNGFKGIIVKIIFHFMRNWDFRSSQSIDFLIAISHFVQKRIFKYYRRESHIIYPPVNIKKFKTDENKDDFYVTVSRIVQNKNIKLIVETFTLMPDKKIFIIGDGPELNSLKKSASNNIVFLGKQEDDVVIQYLQKAKAFVFASEEDFGIAPLEAQACGTPVIALEKGGSKETIIGLDNENPTGVFFKDETPESLKKAIHIFEENIKKITVLNCRKNAERFSSENFKNEFKRYVEKIVKENYNA